MAAISWIIFSRDAFVSQETFANKLCSGILAAKSEMNLDMRWDYLDVTVHTTDNSERLGWGQSQNPQLVIVSSSWNWINVFDPFCFAARCYNRSLYVINHQNYTRSCIPRLFSSNYKNSFIETSISESHNLTQIINSNVVLQFESSFFYFTISMKSFHLMTNEMALKVQFISDSLYGRKK